MKRNGLPFVPSPDSRPRFARDIRDVPDFSIKNFPSTGTQHGPSGAEEDYATYSVVTFDTAGLLAPIVGPLVDRFEQTFEVTGDHIYVSEVRGGRPIYLRIGPHRNPLIRLQEGMQLARYFRSVTFSITLINTLTIGAGGSSRALIYASLGPLFLNSPQKEYGLNQPAVFSGTANTNWGQIFAPSALLRRSTGKRGGSVTVVNTDLANTLYFDWQIPGGAVASGFPILPGQTAELPFESTIESSTYSLVLGTLAGTCGFRAIVSDGQWAFDCFDGDQPIGDTGLYL